MNAPKPETQVLLAEQTEALTLYLDALFADKPVYLPVPVVATAPPLVPSRVIELSATRVEAVVAPVIVPAAVVTVVAPPVIIPVTPAPAVETRTQTAVETTRDEPRPDWANEPFPCLLLKVHGLSLALPLVKLNRILPWAEPTLIPGYAAWLLGVLRLEGLNRNLKVVDTAALVMPERIDQAPLPEASYQHIVMIGEGEWGLTCEDVSSVITIDPAKVRWRTSRSKRPWLAGTVVEHLCALLDAERLAEMLSAGAPDLAS
jgi:purine-binding chemotaxis protein CheW